VLSVAATRAKIDVPSSVNGAKGKIEGDDNVLPQAEIQQVNEGTRTKTTW
jgi:hypothetical protein